jgi:signal transduction histidine kinase
MYINFGIFVFATGGGYWLAGETLEPIEKAMEDQKRFIADASHELRTPLTALKTSMEVALRSNESSVKKARAIIEENLESVNDMEALTTNLLSLASYDQNGQRLKFEDLELTEIIRKSVEKIKPLAEKKKIRIDLDLKETVVRGDQDSLERMMIVFLDNAVKYTEKKGKVEVNLSRENKYAEINVSDNGRGISEEDLPHIFDRFYRVDQSRCKDDVCGYGLGLSVAKKIIDLHRGSVVVKSELDQGTTFIAKLPLA